MPYYWAGIKLYDIIAGSKVLKPSYFLSKTKSLELFPMLKRDKLAGALVYYDGESVLCPILHLALSVCHVIMSTFVLYFKYISSVYDIVIVQREPVLSSRP